MSSSFGRAVAPLGNNQHRSAIIDTGGNKVTSDGVEFVLKGKWKKLKSFNISTCRCNQVRITWGKQVVRH